MKPSLVIIGLGNPGASYERTRHNAGFVAVDELCESFGEGEWKEKQKFLSIGKDGRVVTVPVLFIKPNTYMNRSGEAVKKIVDFYKLNAAEQILVITDDIDIPLGTVRLKKSGGPGTHNGLKSIVEQLGENFPRLRVGIGPKPANADLANWVLSVFSEEELETLDKVYLSIPEMVKNFILEAVDE